MRLQSREEEDVQCGCVYRTVLLSKRPVFTHAFEKVEMDKLQTNEVWKPMQYVNQPLRKPRKIRAEQGASRLRKRNLPTATAACQGSSSGPRGDAGMDEANFPAGGDGLLSRVCVPHVPALGHHRASHGCTRTLCCPRWYSRGCPGRGTRDPHPTRELGGRACAAMGRG